MMLMKELANGNLSHLKSKWQIKALGVNNYWISLFLDFLHYLRKLSTVINS